ncbi:hypothetical protein TNCV_2377371 [Trichonephila clavipes]|nr:hypothetical protein TNCV_2377371 [Trichonephila clavipes]
MVSFPDAIEITQQLLIAPRSHVIRNHTLASHLVYPQISFCISIWEITALDNNIRKNVCIWKNLQIQEPMPKMYTSTGLAWLLTRPEWMECPELDEYPADDIVSRYWETRRQMVKKSSTGVG